MKRISKSKKEEFGLRAALAGVKLPSGWSEGAAKKGAPTEFNEKDDEAAGRAIKKAQERVQARQRK